MRDREARDWRIIARALNGEQVNSVILNAADRLTEKARQLEPDTPYVIRWPPTVLDKYTQRIGTDVASAADRSALNTYTFATKAAKDSAKGVDRGSIRNTMSTRFDWLMATEKGTSIPGTPDEKIPYAASSPWNIRIDNLVAPVIPTSSAGTQPLGNPTPPAGQSWALTWADEFDDSTGSSGPGNGLSKKKWNIGWQKGPVPSPAANGVQTQVSQPVGQAEIQYYGPAGVVFPGDGAVHLRMQDGVDNGGAVVDTRGGTHTVESGMITTAGLMVLNPRNTPSVPSGPVNINGPFVLEVRMRIPGPDSEAAAYWPVVWLTNAGNYGSNGSSFPGGTSYSEEIDVWEWDPLGALGSDARFHMHQASEYGVPGAPSSMASTDLSLAYHTYTFWSDGNTLKTWVDGVLVSTVTPTTGNVQAQWANPQYLMIAFQALAGAVIPTGNTPPNLVGAKYLATTGSDANPGTSAAPWLTFEHALAQLTAGNTLVVRGGTYTGNVGDMTVAAGTAAQHITVRAAEGEVVTVAGDWLLTGADFWDFRGINVTWTSGVSSNNNQLVRFRQSDSFTWKFSEIKNAHGVAGFYVDLTDTNWEFAYNIVHDTIATNGTNQDHLLYINSCNTSGSIHHNILYNSLNGRAIKLGPGNQTDQCSGVEVYNNTCRNNLGPSAIQVSFTASDNHIHHNICDLSGSSQANITWNSLTGTNNVADNNVGFHSTAVVQTGNAGLIDGGGNLFRDPLLNTTTWDPADVTSQAYGAHAGVLEIAGTPNDMMVDYVRVWTGGTASTFASDINAIMLGNQGGVDSILTPVASAEAIGEFIIDSSTTMRTVQITDKFYDVTNDPNFAMTIETGGTQLPLRTTMLGAAMWIFGGAGGWTRAQEQQQLSTIADNFGNMARIDVNFHDMNSATGDGVTGIQHVQDMVNAGLKRAILIATPNLTSVSTGYESHTQAHIDTIIAEATLAANQVAAIVPADFEVIWEFINEPNRPHLTATGGARGVDFRDNVKEYAFWLHQFFIGITNAGHANHVVISSGCTVEGITNLPGWNTTTKTGTTPGNNLTNQAYSSTYYGGIQVWGPIDWYLDLFDASVVGASHVPTAYGLHGCGWHAYAGGSGGGPYGLEGGTAGANLVIGSSQNRQQLFFNAWRELNRLELYLDSLGAVAQDMFLIITESNVGTNPSWVSKVGGYPVNAVVFASQGTPQAGGRLWNNPALWRNTVAGNTNPAGGAGWVTWSKGNSGGVLINSGEDFFTERAAGFHYMNIARMIAGLQPDTDGHTFHRIRGWNLFRLRDDPINPKFTYGLLDVNGNNTKDPAPTLGQTGFGPWDSMIAAGQILDPTTGTSLTKSIRIPAGATPDRIVVWDPRTGDEWGLIGFKRSPSYSAVRGYHYKTSYDGIPPKGFDIESYGVPMFAGLVREWEIRNGAINHAIAMRAPAAQSPTFQWPTTQPGGSAALGVPGGTRFRLRSTFNINTIANTQGRVIAQALRDYGAILTDQGGAVSSLSIEADATTGWSGTIPDTALSPMKMSDLEAIDARWIFAVTNAVTSGGASVTAPAFGSAPSTQDVVFAVVSMRFDCTVTAISGCNLVWRRIDRYVNTSASTIQETWVGQSISGTPTDTAVTVNLSATNKTAIAQVIRVPYARGIVQIGRTDQFVVPSTTPNAQVTTKFGGSALLGHVLSRQPWLTEDNVTIRYPSADESAGSGSEVLYSTVMSRHDIYATSGINVRLGGTLVSNAHWIAAVLEVDRTSGRTYRYTNENGLGTDNPASVNTGGPAQTFIDDTAAGKINYLTLSGGQAVTVPSGTYKVKRVTDGADGPFTTTRALNTSLPFNGWLVLIAQGTTVSANGNVITPGVTIDMAFDTSNPLEWAGSNSARILFIGFGFKNCYLMPNQPRIAFWYCDHQYDADEWGRQAGIRTGPTGTYSQSGGNDFVTTPTDFFVSSDAQGSAGANTRYLALGVNDSNDVDAVRIEQFINARQVRVAFYTSHGKGPASWSPGKTGQVRVGKDPHTQRYTEAYLVNWSFGVSAGENSTSCRWYGCDLHNGSIGVALSRTQNLWFEGMRMFDVQEPTFDINDWTHSDAMSSVQIRPVTGLNILDSSIQQRFQVHDANDDRLTSRTASWTIRRTWLYDASSRGMNLACKALDPSAGQSRGQIITLDAVAVFRPNTGEEAVMVFYNEAGSTTSRTVNDPTEHGDVLNDDPYYSPSRVTLTLLNGGILQGDPSGGDPTPHDHAANPALLWRQSNPYATYQSVVQLD